MGGKFTGGACRWRFETWGIDGPCGGGGGHVHARAIDARTGGVRFLSVQASNIPRELSTCLQPLAGSIVAPARPRRIAAIPRRRGANLRGGFTRIRAPGGQGRSKYGRKWNFCVPRADRGTFQEVERGTAWPWQRLARVPAQRAAPRGSEEEGSGTVVDADSRLLRTRPLRIRIPQRIGRPCGRLVRTSSGTGRG